MRNNKIITIVIGVILFAGVVGWYLYPSSPEHVAEIEQHIIEKEPVSQQVKKEEKKPIAQSIAEYIKMPNADAAVLERIKKIQKFQSLKTGKFDYYGKVIDQHGDPVVGATVKVDIGYYPFIPNGNFYPSHKKRKLVTDSEGKFSIVGEEGESVSIDLVEKSGYEIHYWFPPLTSFIFSRVGIEGLKKVGNPDKPVIFHAWKKAEAEPLVYSEGFYGFYKSGEPYTIDLNKGKKVKGVALGDLLITFNRDPSGSRMNPSSWAVSVKAIGGGVVETTDLFMNEAPNEGYEPSWNISFKKGALGYKSRSEKHFYLKSRSGKSYSKVKMIFWPYYRADADAIEIKAWVNPNASRNLQYDPSKRIYPK